ncbi:PREDICTED: probable disease resistance protein At5g63020 [Theobroma cacao]|uniref:Probable disease resistance protein At5g63020 n=1 Tax=Theobroma cacao TaxID=3641 RepID=A0AB32WRA9_THECC|nr:PREDICTED: probable disease resistance protein At5g63020 [Theobroma cacao]XP_017980473.1 PREDICTED: probable disease resistance protein At5g63020 [Theobroma cacao]
METAGNVVVKCWDNHRSLDQKTIDLKRKLVDLNALKQDVESRKKAELHPRKKLKSQVDVWLGNVERINDEIQNLEQRVVESISISRGFFMKDVLKKIQEVEELLQQGKFDQGLVVNDLTWIGQALSTTNLVGKAAENCMEEIWTCLMDDDIRRIGVWGMGGLGKTTIMKIINNRLSKMTEKFNIVIWITVSKEMNISKIQNGILRAIGEELREDEDETIRAGKLFEWLNEKGRYVLILDDLWDKLSLEEVGIPKPSNGSKLVVTTRMLDVCRYLGCREIRMPNLPKQDAWSLFLEKVGKDVLNYPGLLPIVESVVEQCAGLPLAIVTVASSMKGITNVHEWRNARNELSKRVRGVTGLDEKVLQQLQFSYDHLECERVQQCFLCCALYPEDCYIYEYDLINLWIAEGLVEEMDSQQAELDQGFTILNKLKNNCLLENGENVGAVKLHDLVRDMVLRITRPRFLVRAGLQLKEIPHVQEWTEDLEKVSLMSNYGLRIPSQMSPPKCQMLTTLLLSDCRIRSIPDCFFEQMKGLKVLDLSQNNFRILPSSISNLEALTLLSVRGCDYLKKLPSFSKLEALKKLDLLGSKIKNLPHGMDRLVNLNYLHLWVEEVPSGILSKFSCLRDLGLSSAFVRGEEIGELKKLEFFEGSFFDLNELNTFVQALKSRGQQLIRYNVAVDIKNFYRFCESDKYIELSCSHPICRNGVKFPSDLQRLRINYGIVDFPEEEVFFPWFIPMQNGKFSFLKEIVIFKCEKIKKLFTCSWVQSNLPNLEELTVLECHQMEEIIASEMEFVEEERMGGSNSNTIPLTLPKLRILDLDLLPELKSICAANRVMVCDSIEEIGIFNCSKLQRIPLYLPLLDDGQPSPPPSLKAIFISSKKQLRSVEWDHPNAKSVLGPILKSDDFLDPCKSDSEFDYGSDPESDYDSFLESDTDSDPESHYDSLPELDANSDLESDASLPNDG